MDFAADSDPEAGSFKYADCPTVEVSVHVDATPEQLWRLVTDIELPARFSSEFQGASWVGGATVPHAGARFVGRNRHPAIGDWETACLVVACQPNRVFGWAVGDPQHPSATWRFDLEPEAGGTKLRQSARLGPGPSGLTPAIEARPDKEERIISRRLEEWRHNMAATLAGIKDLAERGGR